MKNKSQNIKKSVFSEGFCEKVSSEGLRGFESHSPHHSEQAHNHTRGRVRPQATCCSRIARG